MPPVELSLHVPLLSNLECVLPGWLGQLSLPLPEQCAELSPPPVPSVVLPPDPLLSTLTSVPSIWTDKLSLPLPKLMVAVDLLPCVPSFPVPLPVSLTGVVSLGTIMGPVGGHLLLLTWRADLKDGEDGEQVLLVAPDNPLGNVLLTGLSLVSFCRFSGLAKMVSASFCQMVSAKLYSL